MGYKIVYGYEVPEAKAKKGRALRLKIMIAAVFLVFTFTVKQIWPEGTRLLRDYLIPGDLSVTEQAFQTMLVDLRDGADVTDAITAFCREIISYG